MLENKEMKPEFLEVITGQIESINVGIKSQKSQKCFALEHFLKTTEELQIHFLLMTFDTVPVCTLCVISQCDKSLRCKT